MRRVKSILLDSSWTRIIHQESHKRHLSKHRTTMRTHIHPLSETPSPNHRIKGSQSPALMNLMQVCLCPPNYEPNTIQPPMIHAKRFFTLPVGYRTTPDIANLCISKQSLSMTMKLQWRPSSDGGLISSSVVPT
jgi:hypothetical protein